ncbi:hypothetical protein [Xenorhabdus sp. KJ12.1]|uniref:hypothetical protein n=1 Tax=Xenorhabdus sp. KJ12.1 TaxID=1851571 RepID=UPI000C049C8C|nr:hypothetical protein [Xenorhabdus sp. KJ12.1]PHM72345.1 hypothetical protein Xekj_00624 [Xenorhabdus sp. KJ12.1]
MGIAATVLLLFILWSIRIYIPLANAAEGQSVMNNPSVGLSPQPFQLEYVSFMDIFPVIFNIFSIEIFTIFIIILFVGVVIGAFLYSFDDSLVIWCA